MCGGGCWACSLHPTLPTYYPTFLESLEESSQLWSYLFLGILEPPLLWFSSPQGTYLLALESALPLPFQPWAFSFLHQGFPHPSQRELKGLPDGGLEGHVWVSEKALLLRVLTWPAACSSEPSLQLWGPPWIRPLASWWPSSTSTPAGREGNNTLRKKELTLGVMSEPSSPPLPTSHSLAAGLGQGGCQVDLTHPIHIPGPQTTCFTIGSHSCGAWDTLSLLFPPLE